MNNKGFTLVELLASIVVLALILAIAIPSINTISHSIRENQRENVIKEIEIAASKYAFDTGNTIIFVKDLIAEGYIASDDDSDNINDPLNNISLNCYVVEMTKQKDYYSAKFLDNKNYMGNDGECNSQGLNNVDSNLTITGNNEGKWLKGSATLMASGNGITLSCDPESYNKCLWTSSSGIYTLNDGLDIVVNPTGLLETKYTFRYTTYDANDSIASYSASVDLKIDNEAPVIYQNEIKVTDKFIYATSKKVTIEASDGKGSGIAGYYLGLKSNTEDCNAASIAGIYQLSNEFTVTQNGDYLVCVKDNVGNTSKYILTINYIG